MDFCNLVGLVMAQPVCVMSVSILCVGLFVCIFLNIYVSYYLPFLFLSVPLSLFLLFSGQIYPKPSKTLNSECISHTERPFLMTHSGWTSRWTKVPLPVCLSGRGSSCL